MNRVLKITLIAAGALLLAILSLPLFINANQFQPKLQADLTSALGRQVTLGHLSFSFIRGSVTADDLSIADDAGFSSTPFTRAKSLVLSVDLLPFLLSRRLNATALTITEPQITLLQNDAGQWNFASAESHSTQPGSLALSIKLITIKNGMLTVGRIGNQRKPTVLSGVNITVRNFSSTTQFPFELAGQLAPRGDVRLTGQAGPINSRDVSATPVHVNLKLSGVDVSATGITAGTGFAGLMTVDGDATLAGSGLDAKGLIRLDQPRFVRTGQQVKVPVQFDFAIHDDVQKHVGELTSGQIHLGNVPASLTGSWSESGNAASVDMHLSGSGMPIDELAKLLPALGIALPSGSSLYGGTAGVNATITGAATAPLIAGTAQLGNTRLKGFDLSSKMALVEKVAGIRPSAETQIQTFSAAFRTADDNTAISNMKLVAPAIGDLSGSGNIDQRKDLDFHMSASVNAQGPLVAILGQGHPATLPFFIHGTASNPSFEPDVKGIAAAELGQLKNTKLGGVNAGSAVGALSGLFGGKK